MTDRRIPRVIVAIAAACLVFPVVTIWWAKTHPAPAPAPPFAFPTAELAALDHDLQARFAVVPDKDFGIERTYGNQHYLYNPTTPAEIATIAALKKRKTEAAFYLMSRALWLRHWDGYGYKPIQGPVAITGKIVAPIPRRINFNPRLHDSRGPILDQEDAKSAQSGDRTEREGLPTHSPSGQTVPSPTPPANAPGFNQLQLIGNRVFELVEDAPKTANVGATEKFKDWQVIAVPIRANQKACLPCHVYDPQDRNKPSEKLKKKLEVGDALGVAFYAYRQTSKSK